MCRLSMQWLVHEFATIIGFRGVSMSKEGEKDSNSERERFPGLLV
jgi:hypothetical protein